MIRTNRLSSRAGVAVLFASVLCGQAWSQPPKRYTGPWDLSALRRAPKATWGDPSGLVREVYYEGEPYQGKPTRVFAYYGRPAQGDGPFPAMLLVHGGGGKAFAEWATLWAQRGYAALAMDTAGHGPGGKERLPDGGPDQDDNSKFREFGPAEIKAMWTYHAVATVVRGHSLLAARKDVDPDRIGITGISWGGYLTCIVTGIDDRLKVSVPVYGCGFLYENSVWLPRFDKISADTRRLWIENFDPSRYLPGVRCPILFVNGTNDFAYPLDSYQKSYREVGGGRLEAGRAGNRSLCVTVKMPHGHPQGWAPKEIGLFVDNVLQGGDPLPAIGEMKTADGKAAASFKSPTPIVRAQLLHTSDAGPWQKRNWKSVDATAADGTVSAELPPDRPLVYFLNITDSRGATVSTPHVQLAE